MKVNFSNTEGGDFELIPVGTYLCRITEGEINESGPSAKNPGSEYIKWELTIQQDEKWEGRKLFTNTSLLPHALFSLKNLLAAIGKYTPEELGAEEFEWEIDDVIGSYVKVVVKHKTYDGEQVTDVKRIKPAGEVDTADTSLLP